MIDNTDELIKKCKQKAKDYESSGTNPKVLKNLTSKERLAIAEQCLTFLILENKKIKKDLLLIYLILVVNLGILIAIIKLCH